ncbi:MAG: glycosyltransferase [Bacteroidia bacterium]
MRVLLASILPVTDTKSWSGTCKSIYEQIAKNNHVDVCYSPSAHYLQKKLAAFSHYFYKLKGKRINVYFNKYVAYLYGLSFSRKLKRIDPELIVCLGSGTELLYVDSKVSSVLIADACFDLLHNSYEVYSNLIPNAIKQAYNIEKKSLSHFDKIIYTSTWAQDAAKSAYPDLKTYTINLGSNIGNYSSVIVNNKKINANLNLLTVGTDYKRKGIDKAEKLAKKLKCKLTIIGIDLLLDKTKPDERQQLITKYKKADFFVLFPTADCTPIVINEANSFGLPVITFGVGGIPDMISAGKNGHIVENLNEAVDIISSYRNNPAAYNALRMKTRTYYDKHLSWEVFREKFQKIITTA